MATGKLMTEKQTAELIGKTIENLQIEVDLSDYETSADASSALDDLKREIEGKLGDKADSLDLENLKKQVQANTEGLSSTAGLVEQHGESILQLEQNKADKTDLSSYVTNESFTILEGTVNSHSTDLASLDSRISDNSTSITNIEGRLDNFATKGELPPDVSSEVSALQDEVSSINSTLANKAESSDITRLESDINGVKGTLGEKADNSTVTSIQNDVADLTSSKADKSELSSFKEEVNGKLTAVYRYKGTKKTVDELPKSGNTIGDVYDVNNGMNYAWNGDSWDALGESRIEVDAALDASSTNPVQNKTIDAKIKEIEGQIAQTDGKIDFATQTDIDTAYNTTIKPKLTISATLK